MKKPDKKGAASTAVIVLLSIITVVVIAGVLDLTGVISVGGKATTLSAATVQGAPAATGCANPLSTTQSLSVGATDADKSGTSVSSVSYLIYTNPTNGMLNPGNGTTIPGTGYTMLAYKSGELAARADFTTPCNSPTVPVAPAMETLDSSVTMTVYNQGARTTNAASANMTFSAASPYTFRLELLPSALYKHIAGGAQNRFALFINATNQSDWDVSGFSANLVSWGGSCTHFTGPNPTNFSGAVIYGFACNGDFTGKDRGTYPIDVTIKPSASYTAKTAGAGTFTVQLVPFDYFADTVSNALSDGPVKDNGATFQTAQEVFVYYI
jgi:hypothetical protein